MENIKIDEFWNYIYTNVQYFQLSSIDTIVESYFRNSDRSISNTFQKVEK